MKESFVARRRSGPTATSAGLTYLGSSVHDACLCRGRNRIGCLLPLDSTRERVRFLTFRQSLHLSGTQRPPREVWASGLELGTLHEPMMTLMALAAVR